MNSFILPESSLRWLNHLANDAGISPSQHGEQWLLHLLPHNGERTVTISIIWLSHQWQLRAVTNADDWLDMHQETEQVCIDFRMGRYWYCYAGPILPHERKQHLTSFLQQLQATYNRRQFTVQYEQIV